MKKILYILLIAPVTLLMAQKPFINNISPTSGTVGKTITITGTNLGGQVYFGGIQATSVSGSGNVMTAVVPAGAVYGPVTVVNSGLIAESSQQFLISFSGTDITSYDPPYLVPSGLSDEFDICMCDLNGDALNDIVIAHSVSSGAEATIYQNNTTGTDSLEAPDFQVSQTIDNTTTSIAGFNSVICGDINKDGTPELIFSSNAATGPQDIFIYQNTGGASVLMTIAGELKLPELSATTNRSSRKIKVADIDLDGNPDLVIGIGTDATVIIFRGNGDFTFESPDIIAISNGTAFTSSIAVSDLNNDSRPDIISLPFREQDEIVTILKNESQPGAINFVEQANISTSAQRINVSTADFDGDGLNDVIITNRQLQRVTVHRNLTAVTGGDITLGTGQNITISGAGPWGIEIGDMNGDGKPDLIIGSNSTTDNLYVLENISTGIGSISFNTPTALATGNTNQNQAVGDLNGDGRPDIAYTHNVALGTNGSLGIFLNRNCVIPTISPDNIEFCFDDLFTLNATKTAGSTYLWEFTTATNAGSSITPTGDNSTADILVTSGSATPVGIRVTITHDAGEAYECSQQTTQTYNLIGGTQPAAPTINGPAGVICVGDPFTLTAAGGPFDNYQWTLPDGTSSTSDQISVTAASVSDAGNYSLRVRNTGGCFSEESAVFTISISEPPLFEIFNNDLDDFCDGTTVALEVPDFSVDFDYQWYRDGVIIFTATLPTLDADQTGTYRVDIIDPVDGCITETASYAVTERNAPTSVANGPTETCVDFLTSFTSSSTGDAGFNLQYEWVVEDASNAVIFTSNTQDLDYTFTATGNYEVILTTSYDTTEVYAGGMGATCNSSDPIAVTVSAAPNIVFNITDGTQKCQADTLEVSLNSPDGSTISTYEWSVLNPVNGDTITQSTNTSILAFTPANTNTVNIVARVNTTIGCQVQDTVQITNFPTNIDIELANFSTPDTVELEEANFVALTAINITNPSWEPAEIVNNPSALSVTVFPDQPFNVIRVTGIDDNDCTVSSEIVIELDNLRPKKTFSPNGDGQNDCWEILNSSQSDTEGCQAYVFDARGREIFVGDAPFEDNCVWDGNFSGTPVPEGVYYFVFKCDDSSKNKSGSILLAR